MGYAKFETKSPEWWAHLKYNKRIFWHRVKNHYAKKIQEEVKELQTVQAVENGLK